MYCKSVADSEHRNAQLEDSGISGRSIFVIDRRWTAGKNDADRRITSNLIKLAIAGKNDGEDILFADAARDELRILRAKVEDNDGLGFH